MMKPLFTLIGAFFLAAQSLAADLTWQDLAKRPELWPQQVTVKQEMKFQGGAGVAAGQKVNVEAVKPNEIELSTTDGKLNFAADPDETDALTVARAAYSKLTPKQQTLTYATVATQKDLWPAKVALTRSLQMTGGKSVLAGEPLVVQNIQPNLMRVLVEKMNMTFDVAPTMTDLMTQARTFVEDPNAGPRFVVVKQLAEAKQKAAADQKAADAQQAAKVKLLKELDGKLMNSVSGKPDPLDQQSPPKYLVFLRGSSTCPYTRKFAPTLVQYYNQTKPAHPEFEIVWLETETPQDTATYAKAQGFSWRAVEYETTSNVPTVNNSIDTAGRLPQLIVMDQSGKLLANGVRDDAPAALKQLDQLLKQH
jgi:hypothetical protein